jgi:hypothetical protein
VNYIIESMKLIEEYALRKENKDQKDPLSLLVENLASSETHKHIFCFKVTSICESFEFKGIEHHGYSKNTIAKYLHKKGSPHGPDISPVREVTEIKKTVTLINLDVDRQIYIFLSTLAYTTIYIIVHHLM